MCYDSVLQLFTVFIQRWYVSGGVECFTGWHIPLAVLAVAVLALCVALVPLILLSAFDKVYSGTSE